MPEIERVSAEDRIRELTDRLEKGIKELLEGDKFKNYLNTMSKFHDYSFNNTMLIALQKPDATLVAGFNSWKNKFERSVKKGEKGIQIFAPAPYKVKKERTKLDNDTGLPLLDKDGKPVVEEYEVKIPAFKVVSVFDVSQTAGKELPTLGVDELKGDVQNFEKFFEALKTVAPVPVTFEDIMSGAKGYFDKEKNIIAINEGMSETQTVKTAIHEIAHSILHNRNLIVSDLDIPKDRNTEEVEAESVAYTVCQHFGIDTSDYSFAYVASWGSGKELPELKASLETIRATANDIINKIEDFLLGRQKEQVQDRTTQVQEKSGTVSLPEETAFEKFPEPKVSVEYHPQFDNEFILKEIATGGTLHTGTRDELVDFCKDQLAASVVIPQLNELIDKAESERPVVNHCDIPVYLKTVKEARELGEIDLFTQNENENSSCRDFISKTVTENYRVYDSGYGGAFNSDATLKQIMKEYPLDRIALILASRVSAADWDKRFTDRVHKWAKETIDPLPEEVKEKLKYVQINEHSGLVNLLAERVIEQQRELEINTKRDNAFLNSKEDMIAIYQLKHTPENRDISFTGLDHLEKMGKTVDRNNYDLVYSCKVNLAGIRSMPAFLESVYENFNIRRPKDFEGHSLSVSDVVAVKKDGQITANFVDSIGFKELPQFGQIIRDNPLKAIEDAVEQNDNSFDGLINNLPPDNTAEKEVRSAKIEKKSEKVTDEKRSIRSFLHKAIDMKKRETKDAKKQKGMEI